MKQYLLAVHGGEGAPMPPEDEIQNMFAQVDAFNEEVRQAGAWVFAGGLLPPDSATVVKVENGRATTTDGPFAESKEQLGGFWVLKAEDLDEALRWAERASAACMAPVEVRPFQDEPTD